MTKVALVLAGFYDYAWVKNWANIRYAGFGAAFLALLSIKWHSGDYFTYLTYASEAFAALALYLTLTSASSYADFDTDPTNVGAGYEEAYYTALVASGVGLVLNSFAVAYPYIFGSSDAADQV